MSIDKFLDAIKQIKAFPSDKFINRLYNKARQADTADVFRDKLPLKENYGEDQDSLSLDRVDFTPQLKLLAEHALVKGLARFDSGTDKHGLRNCSNTGNAEIVGDSLFSQTSTLLYSEHINWSLKQLGSKDLRELRADPTFATDLESYLKDKHFVAGALRQDLTNHDHTYTTALLWAYDYVHLGPGFTPHLDGAFTSAPSGLLLAHWAAGLFDDSLSPETRAKITLNVSKAASLVHAITNQNNNVQDVSALQHFEALTARGLFSSDHAASVSDGLAQLVAADNTTWKSIAGQNKALWENTENDWSKAVADKATDSNSHTDEISNTGEQFGEGMALALTFGQVYHQNWRTTITTGQSVADWINRGRREYSSLFTSDAPGVVDTNDFTTNGPPPGSCFVAGTIVATERGNVPIQDLREGHHVLTRADPVMYGIRSDEEVVVPLSSALLCGFNDEKPFFTAGHIFHTTSGLRAVEPSIAKSENPWLDVNALAPGHVLYRHRENGQGYELVEIKHISREHVEDVQVYGVHLREGHRSYHANGYLVAVNYPEITVKSIAKMLATFPQHMQMTLLHHIKELKPLFARFGAGTISEALSRELHAKTFDPPRPGFKEKAVKRRTLVSNLRKAKRTFLLHATEEIELDDYELPLLTIHDGNVLLNGVAQHRATIDKDDKTIRWTRSVAGYGYEHGYLSVLNHGFAGSGAIVLSSDPDQVTIDSAQSGIRIIKFHAAKPNANVETPSVIADHQRHTRVAKFLKTQHMIQSSGAASTAVLEARPKDEVHTQSTLSNHVAIPGLEVNLAVADPGTAIPGDIIDNEDTWDLTMDTAIWPSKTPAPTKMTSPVKLGQISFCTYHAGGTNGIPVPIVTMPLLDQLCRDINAAHLPALNQKPRLTTLYSSHLEITKNGTQMGTILVDSASLIYQLADKPSGSQELSSLTNLTFKNSINSDVKLPLLFRTLALELSGTFSSIKGAILEYDNDHRGGDGARHFVCDSDTVPVAIRPMAMLSRLAISRTLAESRSQPIGMLATMSAAPAPVTMALAEETQLTTGALIGLTGYNSASLHNTSQALLQNTMEFHMNESDRTHFLQTKAPENHPPELGDKMDDDLKKWVREVYAPAYVSFMISQVKPTEESRKWRDPLTDAEQDKIWYWWQGSGETCLAKSPKYNQLNALASMYAMRQLHGVALDPYIKDGGEKWAKKMFEDLTRTTHAMNGLLRVPIGGGEVVLNKYCNIMQALDPKSTYADELFNTVVSYAVANNISNPLFPLDEKAAKEQKEWLYDAMRELIVKVLSKDSSLPFTVATELKNDMDKLIKDWAIVDKKTNEDIAKAIADEAVELIGNIVMYMQHLGDGFKALARLSAFKSATALINKGIEKITSIRKTGFPFLKGTMVILVTAGYIYSAVSAFSNWSNLSGPERSIAIISTIATVIDVVDKSFSLFQDIKKWQAGKYSKEPITAEDGAKLEAMDQNLSEKITSPEGASNLNAANVAAEKKTLRESYGDNIVANDQPTVSSDVGPRNVEDVNEEGLIANQAHEEPPEGLSPTGRTAWKKLTVGERLMKCANIAVGIAFTVSMSLDLKDKWDTYNDVGKALNVLQVAVQGLTVLVDAAILIGDAAVTAGYIAAESTIMVALPVLGAILALIGIVVMIVLMRVNTHKDEEPPKTPVEEFLTKSAHPLIKDWSSPPAQTLSYTLATAPLKSGSETDVKIIVANNSDKDLKLKRTTITMDIGGSDDALFAAPTSDWVLWKDGTTRATGTANTDHPDLYTGLLTPQHRGSSFVSWDFAVAGPLKNGLSGALVVKAKQAVVVSWLGTINKFGSSIINIVETLENGDNCRVRMPAVRV